MKRYIPLFLIALLAMNSLACLSQIFGIQQTETNITNTDNSTNIVVVGDGNTTIVTENTEQNTVQSAATEAPTATAEPKAAADDVCFFSGWHNGWTNGPERISYVGVFSKADLVSGTSLQASWEKWTNEVKLDSYTAPQSFMPGNDGAFGALICGDIAYIPNRNPNEETVHFWDVSYAQLSTDGLLICKDDTGEHGTWEGDCAGDYLTVAGVAIDDVVVPEDFVDNWSKLMKLMKSWDGPTPDHGLFTEIWIAQ